MENIQVIGLAASPRKGGNSETLLDAFLEGARSAGAETEKIRLKELKMNACIDCQECFKNGLCTQKDDVYDLLPRLVKSQVVALASPMYFYSLTPAAHTLISRAQSLWAAKYVLKKGDENTGRGVLIAVGATRGKRLFDGVSLTAKHFFDAFNKTFDDRLEFRGVDAKGDILKVDGALDQARELGARVVGALKTKNTDGQNPSQTEPAVNSPVQAGDVKSILELAIRQERLGRELYAAAADLVDDQGGSDNFHDLSGIALGNVQRLEGIKSGDEWKKPEGTGATLPNDIARTERPVEPDNMDSFRQVVLEAIKVESGLRVIYIWLAKLYKSKGLGSVFSELAEEKSRHQQLLDELLIRRFTRY